MKVRDLIERLKKENPEDMVLLYDYQEESGGILTGVGRQRRDAPNEWKYFGGDHPFHYRDSSKIGDNLVLLTSG